jgi:tRNA(Ile)-lysidine synthase
VRAAEAATPIADGELDALFSAIASARKVALAVSGGADSLALLDCADRWRRLRDDRPEAIVLTVDHGLRRRSDREAAAVARIARARGLDVHILTWAGPRPEGDVEARAREARYRLMLQAMRETGASHLLLAHHRDDQAETFLMRLSRGSGLFGLAAMRPEIRSGEATILRPFLDLPRSRLVATTAAAGLAPVADPMNDDPRFLRTRMRRLLPILAAEGIAAADLAATAGRLAGAADALDQWASRAIAAAVSVDDLAVAWLDPSAFFAEPVEIRYRVLTRLLLAIGGDSYPPRFERLAALHDAMAKRSGRFKRTLAGTVVEGRGDRFALYREFGRAGLPAMPVPAGFGGVWDHRFRVEMGVGAPAGIALEALGEDGRLAVGARGGAAPPGAVAALPAFRLGGRLLAVPPLGFSNRDVASLPISARTIVAERLADPPRFPEFTVT